MIEVIFLHFMRDVVTNEIIYLLMTAKNGTMTYRN